MRRKRTFTLLEILVGMAILALVSSTVIWKMSRFIERKRFDSSAERIQARLFTCRRLAMNMQADWTALLEKKENEWLFTALCAENPGSFGLPPSKLGAAKILFNGKEADSILFSFSATGESAPRGVLEIIDEHLDQKRRWNLPHVFYDDGSQKQRILHPEDSN